MTAIDILSDLELSAIFEIYCDRVEDDRRVASLKPVCRRWAAVISALLLSFERRSLSVSVCDVVAPNVASAAARKLQLQQVSPVPLYKIRKLTLFTECADEVHPWRGAPDPSDSALPSQRATCWARDPGVWNRILEQLPSLVEIIVEDGSFGIPTFLSKRGQEDVINDWCYKPEEALILGAASQHCPKLTRLLLDRPLVRNPEAGSDRWKKWPSNGSYVNQYARRRNFTARQLETALQRWRRSGTGGLKRFVTRGLIDPPGLLALLEWCPELKNLEDSWPDLPDCRIGNLHRYNLFNFSPENMKRVLESYGRNWRCLTLTQWQHVSDDFLDAFRGLKLCNISSLKLCLEERGLGYGEGEVIGNGEKEVALTSATLGKLFESLPNLRYFYAAVKPYPANAQDFPIFETPFTAKLAALCPSLEMFKLQELNDYGRTDLYWQLSDMSALAAMPNLRKIGLRDVDSCCPKHLTAGLFALARSPPTLSLPHLRRFTYGWRHFVRSEAQASRRSARDVLRMLIGASSALFDIPFHFDFRLEKSENAETRNSDAQYEHSGQQSEEESAPSDLESEQLEGNGQESEDECDDFDEPDNMDLAALIELLKATHKVNEVVGPLYGRLREAPRNPPTFRVIEGATLWLHYATSTEDAGRRPPCSLDVLQIASVHLRLGFCKGAGVTESFGPAAFW
ncbi:hypothetical protein HDU86_007659 [Geranomyces michiganensis]|nr:hypothetical protein HDU86_007659 [Geranomyces michiganensis]